MAVHVGQPCAKQPRATPPLELLLSVPRVLFLGMRWSCPPISDMALSPILSLCCSSSPKPTIPLLSRNHLGLPKLSKFHPEFSRTPHPEEISRHSGLREAIRSLSGRFIDQVPDEIYSPLLELCAIEKALFQGQQIHARMVKTFEVDDSVFLSTKLAFMYGNCASLLSAEKIFDKMCHRTIFTWNAIIGASVSNGEPLKALELYREMRFLGIPLDSCTFLCVLKACGMIKDPFHGAEIHGLAIKIGFVSVSFVLNSLVSMYAKCNDLDAMRRLFCSMNGKEDLVSWNSIISAYAANGQSMEALELFREMNEAGISSNTYTFVSALQACDNSLSQKLGMEIHGAVLKSNYHMDIFVANALIAMYAKHGRIKVASVVFNRLLEKDIVSWNTMLSGFVQNDLHDEAIQLFRDMHNSGQKPDKVSTLNVIAACARLGNLKNGREIHAFAVRNRLDSDLQIGNSLTDMYGKCYCLTSMERAFDRILNKDAISWTTVISGYSQNSQNIRALKFFRKVQMEDIEVDSMMIGSILSSFTESKRISSVKEIHGYIIRKGLSDCVLQNVLIDVYGECGTLDYAKKVFESMASKNVVSWTSMISCYDHSGLPNEALELFYCMMDSNIEPDYVSLVSILSAAGSLSSLKKGKEIHGFLIRKNFDLVGVVGGALVDMYSRCGTIKAAYSIFSGMRNKDLILWTTMISAYGMHGCGKSAIDLFNEMEAEKICLDHIIFLALLYACSHSGLVDEGRRIFRIMTSEYKLEPWEDHYACLVDILGRGNCLEEAYKFVQNMHIQPTAEIWCALLRASWVYSNEELTAIAAEKLLELDLESPGKYVLLSNVFAACGRWKDVEKVRMKMSGSGLKKNPGCSCIEIGNKVETFTSRDKSHPETAAIYQALGLIRERLERESGYVPETKYVFHDVGEEEKVEMLYGHSERLALAYGLIKTSERSSIRITKNLRICGDCHNFCKLVSKLFERELIIRDANRFHHFNRGNCSCGDFW